MAFLPASGPPETVTLEYRGQVQTIQLVAFEDTGEAYGYNMECSKCGRPMMLRIARPAVHRVEILNGKLTAHPSLVCPHGCGWHVWVRDGAAVDC